MKKDKNYLNKLVFRTTILTTWKESLLYIILSKDSESEASSGNSVFWWSTNIRIHRVSMHSYVKSARS